MVEAMGAVLTYSLVSDIQTTHFVFQSKRPKDGNKDFKLALESGKFVVHPKWLEACREANTRLPESVYKHTLDTSRSLEVGLNSQTMGNTFAAEKTSQAMRSGTSCSLGDTDTDKEDMYSLPPPLKPTGSPGMLRDNRHQSTPRTVRSPVPSVSPPSQAHVSSASTLTSSSHYNRGKPAPDDSGFMPSPDKQDASSECLNHHPSLSSSSSSSSLPRHSSRMARAQSDAENLSLNTSEPDSITSDSAKGPSNTAVTRDLLAEMNAIMEADLPNHLSTRLPYQQTGVTRTTRRLPGKAVSNVWISCIPLVSG